jgi:antitoxin component YwqK of YwqJK toxin-antitoxin module
MKKLIVFAVVCCMSAITVSAQDLSPTISSKNSSNAIIQKDGVYYLNNNLYTGTYTAMDENGAKKSTLEIKEGKAHGEVTYYYASGKVMERGAFVNGVKTGEWLRWSEEGQKIAQAFYKEGKKDGLWLVWDLNGMKRYEMNYSMGEKVGKWMMWDEKGNLTSEKEYSSI